MTVLLMDIDLESLVTTGSVMVKCWRLVKFYWKVELLLKSEWKAYYNDS